MAAMKAFCCCVLAVACSLAEAADWPRLLGPAGDGKSSETGLRLDWPESGPPVVWRARLGDGHTSPVISGGRLFEFDRWGSKARLTCRNAKTGEALWRSEYESVYKDYYGYNTGPRGSAVVDDDRVYTLGVEGLLCCHRVADGKLVWDVDTKQTFGVVQNFFGTGSTPIVEGDLLIAIIGGSPASSPAVHTGAVKGNGSGIVALDKFTGRLRYRVTDALASYSSPVTATIGGRRWGFAFARGGLIGFEPSSGEVDFEFPWRARKLESVNAANPVVVGDRVFITECYGPGAALLRVKPGGYDVLWKDPPRGKSLAGHWATPIHVDGTLYGSSGEASGEAELRAVELATGKVLWKRPGMGRTTMILADGHLLVLGERGRLRAVRADPDRYVEVASTFPLVEYPAWNPPALADGLLYVRGKNRLVVLDLRSKGLGG